jgi:hypothetical protein
VVVVIGRPKCLRRRQEGTHPNFPVRAADAKSVLDDHHGSDDPLVPRDRLAHVNLLGEVERNWRREFLRAAQAPVRL